jgi:hypothetical protein
LLSNRTILAIALLVAFPVEIFAFKDLGFALRLDKAPGLPSRLIEIWGAFSFFIHFPALLAGSDPGSPLVFITGYIELAILVFFAVTVVRTGFAFAAKTRAI